MLGRPSAGGFDLLHPRLRWTWADADRVERILFASLKQCQVILSGKTFDILVMEGNRERLHFRISNNYEQSLRRRNGQHAISRCGADASDFLQYSFRESKSVKIHSAQCERLSIRSSRSAAHKAVATFPASSELRSDRK
jgi:hypothetical protein